MKILLVTPPYHAGVVESAGRWMPLSLVYLAGAVREAGFDVKIYDAMTKQHTMKKVATELRLMDPDLVAVTSITSSISAAVDVLRCARENNPRVKTILGGVHPTFCYQELVETHGEVIDYIVRGEGERTLRALMKALDKESPLNEVPGITFVRNGNIVNTPQQAFVEDLDLLPAAWDLVDWQDYRYFVIPGSRLAAISTSRGCTHGCTFCSQQKFWKKTWRSRRPARIVDEIEMLKKNYGVNVFLIVDEYPTRDRDRWEDFLDRLIQRRLDICLLMETRVQDIVRDGDILWKYRKAGIVHVYIGVEATDQDTLDLIKKDMSVEESREAIRLLQGNRIITETSFVLGFPWETTQSIELTLQLARHYGPDFAHFLAITPWPYADMYREMQEFIEVYDYSKYNLVEPIIRPKNMSLDDVRQAILTCYKRYYTWKMPEYCAIGDPFRLEYLKRSMHLIMKNSFLSKLISHTGRKKEFEEMSGMLSTGG